MIFLDNKNNYDPRVNLALEEHALRTFDIEDKNYLLFYINEPSVIIGKHQNTLEEINTDFIDDRGIHVVRRLSGGGAVYHDRGNLNFSFITKYDPKHFNNYAQFNGPVIRALQKLGVNAELNGRNDILVEGRKISGNAQFTSRDRMFSHGTLLFDTNLDDVVSALNVNMGKIESKGIKSIRSRVANISEFLRESMTIEEFRQHLLDNIFEEQGSVPVYPTTDEDWQAVEELSAQKYRQWDWNYGRSPAFNVQRKKRFPIGELDLRIDVQEGRIEHIRLYGDFFAKNDTAEIELLLQGVRYDKHDIAEALRDLDIEMYFSDLPKEEFLELVY